MMSDSVCAMGHCCVSHIFCLIDVITVSNLFPPRLSNSIGILSVSKLRMSSSTTSLDTRNSEGILVNVESPLSNRCRAVWGGCLGPGGYLPICSILLFAVKVSSELSTMTVDVIHRHFASYFNVSCA